MALSDSSPAPPSASCSRASALMAVKVSRRARSRGVGPVTHQVSPTGALTANVSIALAYPWSTCDARFREHRSHLEDVMIIARTTRAAAALAAAGLAFVAYPILRGSAVETG